MDNTTIIFLIIAVLSGVGLTLIYLSRTKSKSITPTDALSLDFRLKEELDLKENNRTTVYEQKGVDDNELKKEDSQLRSRLEELEEEVADLEDEISELGIRNKRIKEEKDALDDKIYRLEKEKGEILDVKMENEKKLDEIIKLNCTQKERLDFVSDLLNAHNATNEEFQEKDHKTWEIFSFIADNLGPRLSFLNNNIIDDNYFEKCWNWRNQEIKTWIKNKKVVAIVGEFSAGKTSIVNRILKQDDPNALELPVKSTETTAVPTYISQGKDFNCQFYSSSGDLKNISSTSFQKITKSVIDDMNISSIVKYFVLSYKNENLSDISILDTPGFSSTSEEIISKTTEVVKEADALFWVVDANTGEINNSSVDVLKENLNGVPLYIIINKSDTKSQSDLESLIEKVEETLNRNGITYQKVIPFSKKMKADCLIDILNSVSPRENPDIISELIEQIDWTLMNANRELKELKSAQIDLENQVANKKQILENLISDIDHSVEDIERAVEFKDSFWGEDYHKISKSNYKKFENGKNKIVSSNSHLPASINEFFDILHLQSENREAVYEQKSKIRNLEDAKKDFEELINYYNHLQNTGILKLINQ
ncbi:dynamin family protein [Salegentibacter maritimus]|uniref:Dynamin family protein n=1 Tax=Salegentibacter maritimus TaxID=2794347 RepID=A0ABS0TM01_9FLAO|nr:dynamin family protein [Salegentibacter maritimus]MBI6121023.1 dynamin family protein [Salegentibacter maritimus]